jgi:PAS domain S-box-containing protein
MKKYKLTFAIVSVISIMLFFFGLKTLVTFGFVKDSSFYNYVEYLCFITFCIPSYFIGKTFLNKSREEKNKLKYSKKLSDSLIKQSHNEVFFSGNIEAGSAILSKEVSDTIESDRCSFWLYNHDNTSIVCQNLYIRAENNFYRDIELFEKDFPSYFQALRENPIIVADDAETHTATSCFLEGYLKPLGVKSMLDVPIWYRGKVIGVICIESLSPRIWKKEEVNFAQMLSSLFSFGYSVNESNKLSEELKIKEIEISNRMNAINRSNAVIEFDLDGNIKFANNAFLDTIGYSHDEIVGKHHSLFLEDSVKNTKEYEDFWKLLRSGNFFSGEIVRKKKNGKLIHLQATYNPIIGNDGKPYRVMKIATDITESFNQQKEIEKKNTYLEHAAKILRHDMHSGINTYMPRGLSSLDRRLSDDNIKELKIEAPIKMIKEGLRHTQKVYKGVYEFTNLVKKDVVLNRSECNLKDILEDYLSATAYRPQVDLSDLGYLSVNEALFCTALDNLIRNGLKYNDSNNKIVKIYRIDDILYVEDNGRGLSSDEFKLLSQPYTRKEGQKESGTGLGLNICIAILEEHGFSVSCDKLPEIGSQIKINLKND